MFVDGDEVDDDGRDVGDDVCDDILGEEEVIQGKEATASATAL